MQCGGERVSFELQLQKDTVHNGREDMSVVGMHGKNEKLTGHVIATLRKQRLMHAAAQTSFCILNSLEPLLRE